jgi:hypothetical protein
MLLIPAALTCLPKRGTSVLPMKCIFRMEWWLGPFSPNSFSDNVYQGSSTSGLHLPLCKIPLR